MTILVVDTTLYLMLIYIPIFIFSEVREKGIIQLEGGHYEKNKDFSQEVLVDIPERITEHGLSSEFTQSSGGSSDTSEGSENSGSFEDYGSSDED
ncbi:hypothetical protein Tco_1001794 [Tanacetum coccineum]